MVNSAIILAGGKGERLRPYTEDRPKPMVSIMGQPLLTYHLRWLRAHGYQRVVVCCGYKSDVIQEHCGDGSKFSLELVYSVEKEPLGRGGAIKAAMRHIDLANGQPILAMNGDLMTNLHIDDFKAYHHKNGAMATVATVPLVSPYGITELGENDEIIAFREKPELPFWINAGIYMLQPQIFDLLPEVGDHETTTFPKLAEQKLLKAYKSRAFWRTVDTVKDLGDLRREMESYFVSSFLSPGGFMSHGVNPASGNFSIM